MTTIRPNGSGRLIIARVEGMRQRVFTSLIDASGNLKKRSPQDKPPVVDNVGAQIDGSLAAQRRERSTGTHRRALETKARNELI